jgi:hypothetical protein
MHHAAYRVRRSTRTKHFVVFTTYCSSTMCSRRSRRLCSLPARCRCLRVWSFRTRAQSRPQDRTRKHPSRMRVCLPCMRVRVRYCVRGPAAYITYPKMTLGDVVRPGRKSNLDTPRMVGPARCAGTPLGAIVLPYLRGARDAKALKTNITYNTPAPTPQHQSTHTHTHTRTHAHT